MKHQVRSFPQGQIDLGDLRARVSTLMENPTSPATFAGTANSAAKSPSALSGFADA